MCHRSKYVARGLCVLATNNGPRGECQYQIVISAMKKFTGGPGDDDDLAEVGASLTRHLRLHQLNLSHD
jgi:hypothetical protein